jgi:hypothetical protein
MYDDSQLVCNGIIQFFCSHFCREEWEKCKNRVLNHQLAREENEDSHGNRRFGTRK